MGETHRSKIAAGELGKLETFRALSRDTYPPSLKFVLSSDGLFLDMAIHDFDMARFLVGSDVTELFAAGGVMCQSRRATTSLVIPRCGGPNGLNTPRRPLTSGRSPASNRLRQT